MSADCFFLKRGWLGKSRPVGPLSEPALLKRIDNGEIAPDTLLQSESKTRGHWIPMNKVGPAFKRWNRLHPEEKPETNSS